MTEDLFSYADKLPAHQRHSPTSRAAAVQIKKAIGPMHELILEHLKTCPEGATDEEMQFTLRMPANTQRPRRRELQRAGLIADSGMTQSTRSGRQAVVWILAERK